MVTVEDQAVRPPRRSETMLKVGGGREKRAQWSVGEREGGFSRGFGEGEGGVFGG